MHALNLTIDSHEFSLQTDEIEALARVLDEACRTPGKLVQQHVEARSFSAVLEAQRSTGLLMTDQKKGPQTFTANQKDYVLTEF